MRLALVISSLGPGGAEGVFVRIADGLARRGHAVTLFTLADGGSAPFRPLDPRIRLRPLGLAGRSAGPFRAVAANLRRVAVLRREIAAARPAAVLSFMDATNVLVLLAVGRRLPVVAAERVHSERCESGPAWRLLRRLSYPLAAAVVVQTAAAAAGLSPRIRRRCRVLPNPAVRPEAAAAPALLAGLAGPVVLAMGRLVPQKGFDVLLDAFARLAPRFPDWTLVVCGEGPDRQALEARRDALGLRGRVLFPGGVDRPGGAFGRADVFVLSSRYEGFPNVLLEAMASGVPAVAFACPDGPAEIVREGVDGLLVAPGNAAALAAALGRLMADPGLRRRLAGRAPEVLERFGLEKVLRMWETVLSEAAK